MENNNCFVFYSEYKDKSPLLVVVPISKLVENVKKNVDELIPFCHNDVILKISLCKFAEIDNLLLKNDPKRENKWVEEKIDELETFISKNGIIEREFVDYKLGERFRGADIYAELVKNKTFEHENEIFNIEFGIMCVEYKIEYTEFNREKIYLYTIDSFKKLNMDKDEFEWAPAIPEETKFISKDEKYFLFVSENANFQMRSVLIPISKFDDKLKNDIEKLRNSCEHDVLLKCYDDDKVFVDNLHIKKIIWNKNYGVTENTEDNHIAGALQSLAEGLYEGECWDLAHHWICSDNYLYSQSIRNKKIEIDGIEYNIEFGILDLEQYVDLEKKVIRHEKKFERIASQSD